MRGGRWSLSWLARFAATALVAGGVSAADLSAQYTWQPIRIGAGGWVCGIIISAGDANVRFVRDDTGQAYRWDTNRLEWMPLSMQNTDGSGFGISIIPVPSHALAFYPRSFALDLTNDSVVYLYASFGDQWTYGSLPMNVYKSTDGGKNFTATRFNNTAGFTLQSGDTDAINFRVMGERLGVDPNNSSVVYIGTGSKGLFKSTDGGTNWSRVSGSGLPVGVDFMNVLPCPNGGITSVNGATVSSVIYLVCATNNVYYSSDGGQSWTNITSIVGPANKCEQATLDPNNGVLYVPTTDHNLWKYSGGNWSQIKTGGCDSVTVDPNNSSRLFVVLSGGGQVSRSLDGGSTWANLGFSWAGQQGFSGSRHPTWRSVSKILMDRDGYVWQVEGNDGVIKWLSNDGTSSPAWTPDCKGVENFVAMDIVIPQGGGDKAIVSVQDENGLVINHFDNFDVTPIEPQSNLTLGNTVAVCPNDPNTWAILSYDLWLGTGSWSGITTNNGTHYTTFKTMGTLPGDLSGIGELAISRRGGWSVGADHIVFLGKSGAVPYYSKDGGYTWTKTTTDMGTNLQSNSNGLIQDRELVADPFVPDKFYLNFELGGFWVTVDGGVTWTRRSSPATDTYGTGDIRLAANYAVTNDLWLNLWHSTNGGVSWRWAQGSATGSISVALGAGRGQPGDAPYTVYYAVSQYIGSPATDYGIYRSVNGGASWDRIACWPAGLIGYNERGMMAASWDTFGLVALANGGGGFLYGKPLSTPSSNPTNISISINGPAITLSWPADHIGWRLLTQTNHLDKGISLDTNDWAPVLGSASTNQVTMPIDAAGLADFYRLVYP